MRIPGNRSRFRSTTKTHRSLPLKLQPVNLCQYHHHHQVCPSLFILHLLLFHGNTLRLGMFAVIEAPRAGWMGCITDVAAVRHAVVSLLLTEKKAIQWFQEPAVGYVTDMGVRLHLLPTAGMWRLPSAP